MPENKISLFRIYTWIFIIVLIIAVGGFFLFGDKGSQPNEELGNIALKLNLNAPVTIDSFTRFDSARVLPGNKFKYSYTLLGSSKSMIDTTEILTEGKQLLTSEIKNGYGFAYFKTYNTEIVFCFYDTAGEFVCRMPIGPNEYK